MTGEQRAAFAQVRSLAGPLRLRVKADVEGFPIIPGKLGQIEWAGGSDLAVHTTRRRLFEKVWAVPGVRRHQTGDTEIRALFPPEALEQVAAVIRARRKRQTSSNSLANLVSPSIQGGFRGPGRVRTREVGVHTPSLFPDFTSAIEAPRS